MIPIIFFIILALTTLITNKKNDAETSEEILKFEHKDSFIIFAGIVFSFVIDFVSKKYFHSFYFIIAVISSAIFLMVLIIVNVNREVSIKKRHDQVVKVYQALADMLGKVDVDSIDFNNVPFILETDKKTDNINLVTIDTSLGGKFNENTIIQAQYSINKFFPDLQWTSETDYPKRQVIFKGLPKPPDIAMYPGSDYRPTEWIALGVSGAGEVVWNLADPRDRGKSSYIDARTGKTIDTVDLPSAPQCMCLGSPLALDTIIPTTKGYITMENITVGDIVFDINNIPSEVIGLSPIKMSNIMFEMLLKNDKDCLIVKSDEIHKFPVVFNQKQKLMSMYELFVNYKNKDLKLAGNDILWDILSINIIQNELVKCIRIESETHLFLITSTNNICLDWNGGDSYPFKACGTSNTGGGKSLEISQIVYVKS